MSQSVYTLGDTFQLTLALDAPRFGLASEDLFAMAARQNSKRSFLFVSRVLGKHLPIRPAALLAAGKLLAMAYTGEEGGDMWAELIKGTANPPFSAVLEQLDRTRHRLDWGERTLFVGFAETATGLARAVADCFSGPLRYVSTTRAALPNLSAITFDEAHSHARTHMLHLNPADPFLRRCRRAVLVDDEVTTGNTALRLIRRLRMIYGIRHFALLTLLDNSESEAREELEEEYDIDIEVISLLHGSIEDLQESPPPAPVLDDRRGTPGTEPIWLPQPGLSCADRWPLSAEDLAAQRTRYAEIAAKLSPDEGPTLYLGTGEFIYAPALMAGLRGAHAFHSTTQSPVVPIAGSAVVSGGHFDALDCYSSTGYLYNVPPGAYQQAVIFAEAVMLQQPGLRQLTAHLKDRGAQKVTVVTT